MMLGHIVSLVFFFLLDEEQKTAKVYEAGWVQNVQNYITLPTFVSFL